MTNKALLLSKIVAKGYNIGKMSELIKISKTSMSYKVNGKREFTTKEIARIIDVLDLTPEDVDAIFFGKQVDDMSTRNA